MLSCNALPPLHPHSRLVASAGVARIGLQGQAVLFHEGRQELVELNETADQIWASVIAGHSPAEIENQLIRAGASAVEASSFVQEMAGRWLQDGWVLPRDIDIAFKTGPANRISLSLAGIGAVVELYRGREPPGLSEMLTPLEGQAPALCRLQIAAWDDAFVFSIDGQCRGLITADKICAVVKATLTDVLAKNTTRGFLVHGALLEQQTQKILITGPPGAGKSTLTAALTQVGFEALSDDVVLVSNFGAMEGVPFALTLKSGAWSLLPDLKDLIESAPIHWRLDGQEVRYFPTLVSSGEPSYPSLFLELDRGDAFAITAVTGATALRTLIDSAFTANGRLTQSQFRALGEVFDRVRAYRLSYRTLDEAVELITTLKST